MRFPLFFSVLMAVALTACSTTNSTTSHNRHGWIKQEEIQKQLAANAYELIRKLRPHWLRSRGRRSIHFDEEASYPKVYVNEFCNGDINSLDAISTEYIKEISYITAGAASARFGLNHASGAILITTL